MGISHSVQESEPVGAVRPGGLSGLWARLAAWFRPGSTKRSRRARAAAPSGLPRGGADSRSGPETQLASRPADNPATDPGQRQLWRDAQAALTEVLNRHAASRRVFRHLGALEHTVAKHGARAPRQMPIEVLEQALAQLESLVTDWSAPGLAFLRSTLSVELKGRLKVRQDKEMALSVFVAPNKLQVDEDSESAFMEFQRHWAAANASAESSASGRPRRAA